jgi:hypothetical protein
MHREAMRDCGAAMARAAKAKGQVPSGTFEPWLAGDRQNTESVAKARNPNVKGAFQVSLS